MPHKMFHMEHGEASTDETTGIESL